MIIAQLLIPVLQAFDACVRVAHGVVRAAHTGLTWLHSLWR